MLNETQTSSVESGVPETVVLRPLGHSQPAYGSTEAEWQSNDHNNANDLWWLAFLSKAMYFSRFAQQGVFYSFLAVFLAYRGFSLLSCGILFAIIMLAQSVGAATLPILSDALLIHTSVGVMSHVVGSLVMVSFIFVNGPQFIQAVTILGVGNFLVGGSGVLADSAVFHFVRTRDLNFGYQRLWGCIGWGLASLAASPIIHAYGLVAMWYVYAFLTPFTSAAIAFLLSSVPRAQLPQEILKAPGKTSWNVCCCCRDIVDCDTDAAEASTSCQNIQKFLLYPLVPVFLFSTFVKGMVFAAASTLFLSIWLMRLASNRNVYNVYLVMGVAMLVMSACEIPILLYSTAIGKRSGVHGALYVASLSYAAWLLSYAYLIYDPWFIVLVQPLHAVAFALPIGLVGAYTTRLAEEAGVPNSTAQGFKQGALNAGRTVGFLVAGWLFQAYSGRLMYKVFGFGSLALLFLVGALHMIAHSRDKCGLFY